jgi:hypothetical protein
MSDIKNQPAFPCGLQSGHLEPMHGGMTLRQYAAIKLKVPDSGEPWLDGMINKSLLNDFAAKALQGYMVGLKPAQDIGPDMQDRIAEGMYSMADAMLKVREA